jgi:subtilisin family serine protease
MRFPIVALVTSLSLTALSDQYVVLFKQAEMAVGSLEHGAYTQALQESNQKSITDLEKWITRNQIRTENKIKNLWLVRGATLSVSPQAANKLKKEPWVHGVYLDKTRTMLPPKPNSSAGSSLGEMGDEATWGLEKMGLPQIREEFPSIDGTGISVGVLDTGVQSKHPELAGKVTHFRDFINALSNEYDDHGHGTHVAGTISGNEVGLAPKARILMAKIFGAAGGGKDSTILEAMQWQFDPDGDPTTADYPRVINNSWGADIEEGIRDIEEFLPYHLAIQTWINGGIVPVFAAGNSGKSPNGMPGGLPDVISVGAINANSEVAEFSSMGPNLWKIGQTIITLMKPDVSAPGVAIASSLPGNKYAQWDGTSMATPHVSGAIALLLQANPKLTVAEVKQLLLETSEKKADNQFGYGIVNAYELVKAGIQRKGKGL